MKKFIHSLFLVLFLSGTAVQAQKGVHFDTPENWRAVLALAESTGKNIFVDVYTTWCGPCKMMDAQVYTDEKLGMFLDSNYIAIKVQMDNTPKDDDYIKSWRNDAAEIARSGKVTAYPTMLFYNAKGDLLYKMVGYRDARPLLASAKFAMSSGRANYRQDIIAYQNGDRDFAKIPGLIRATREFVDDKTLAKTMSLEYKNKYLEKLPDVKLLSRENLEFIKENGGGSLITINDRLFRIAYKNPTRIDSVIGRGTSDEYVASAIGTYIRTQLYKDDKPITKTPNWLSIENFLNKSYSKAPIERLILQEKTGFYRGVELWKLYAESKSDLLKKYPPKNEGMDIMFAYNFPAWDVFLYSDDRTALEHALEWSKKSLEISGKEEVAVQYMDTKANLLYKLGKVQEAIETEKEAINFSKETARRNKLADIPFLEEFEENIRKMQNALPTWKQ